MLVEYLDIQKRCKLVISIIRALQEQAEYVAQCSTGSISSLAPVGRSLPGALESIACQGQQIRTKWTDALTMQVP